MRLAIPFLLLLMAPTGPYAQSQLVERADVTRWGIYDVQIVGATADKNLAGGSMNVVAKRRHVRETTTIFARVCTSFGFEYVLVGAPNDAAVPIRMVTRFPGQGVHNPETGVTTYEHETLVRRTIGQIHFRSYTLENDWEVVPGVWTFELWHGDRKLVDRSFTLSRACGEECDRINRDGQACESRIALASYSRQ